MLGIRRRYSHFVFGVIQSGLTSLIAAIASASLWSSGRFLSNWMISWLFSQIMTLPLVLLAAPAIRAVTLRLTRE